jgi:stage II sporulation protein P
MCGIHRRKLSIFDYLVLRKCACNKKRNFYLRLSLYAAIVLLIILSFVFAGNAKISGDEKSVSLEPIENPGDASGEDNTPETDINSAKFILSQELPVIYGIDLKETETEDNISDNLPETDIYFDVLPENIKMEILQFSKEPKEFSISAKTPQILIYHTHTEEAYIQIAGNEYKESGKWYTKDQTKSVVEVGEGLKTALEGYGFSVIHDKTDHQPPSLTTAYSRSLKTMEKYAGKYTNLRVYIDLHRDAYNDLEAGRKDYITINGEECARVMFVVGTGSGYTGTGFDGKPNYESNYKLALAITNQLEDIKKGFTRPIRVKTGRYNQQVSDMCVLIEVGHNANSLQQAVNSAEYIAKAISRVISISG